MCFSFAAAGWLQMYHFGVAKALQDSGLVKTKGADFDCQAPPKFVGSSAGALASAALVVGTDFDALRDYAAACAIDCRSAMFGAFRIRHYVRRGVELFATAAFKELEDSDDVGTPNEVLAARLTEQLEVYATTLPWLKEKRFTTFEDVEDLEEALTASCLLVPLAGMPFALRDTKEWVLDGGLAAFQPRKGEVGVITVSPLYWTSADIKPTKFVPAWWGLYPPNDAEYRALYSLGYNDALDTLLSKGIISRSVFGRLRTKHCGVSISEQKSTLSVARDAVAFFFFIFVLRPWGLLFVYAEMLLVLLVGTVIALLHDVLPLAMPVLAWVMGTKSARQQRGTRSAAWQDLYLAARNLMSMRVPFHIILGERIPVNSRRLERYSRVYRVLRPFLG